MFIRFDDYIIHHARNFTYLIKRMRMQLIPGPLAFPLPHEKSGPGYKAKNMASYFTSKVGVSSRAEGQPMSEMTHHTP